ncbi:hypothetical protein [Umezawaea beigongshangensis]|uniref:hypothetical protein n=1 Tax=Umezawaea beigongshangensis TaxID=2780383 RepID=UPI001E5E0AF7|nr:hypothetical protein [Umezawaea beigongshangensis]
MIKTNADGERTGYRLKLDTGEFEPNNRPIPEILGATSTSEISSLNEEEFVWTTEEIRGELRGDGPVFALYETIDAMYEQKEREGRKAFTPEERALIRSIRRRTFRMWEEEAARRAAGEPPTIIVRPKF